MAVALEVSSVCNSKCRHCPNGSGLMKREYKGLMDPELAKACLKEIADLKKIHDDFTPLVVLYGNGEPLINKRLPEIVEYANEVGVKVNLSTNVIALKPEHGKIFSRHNVNLIKLSFWGDNKDEYESRVAQKFENALDRAMEFIRHCDDRIIIDINVVKYRSQSLEVDPGFLEVWKQFKDKHIEVYSFYGSDWAGQLPNPELREDLSGLTLKKGLCSHFRDTMVICFDGTFLSCWLDYNRNRTYGKYTGGNLLNLWASPERHAIYDKMLEGGYSDLFPCRSCSSPYTEINKKRILYKLNGVGEYTCKVIGRNIYAEHNLSSGTRLPEYIKTGFGA
jgi:hypothetical protein